MRSAEAQLISIATLDINFSTPTPLLLEFWNKKVAAKLAYLLFTFQDYPFIEMLMSIKPVNPKGNQSWIVIGRTDMRLKLQYLSHMMQRADSLEKDRDAGKDWRQKKEMTEDGMVGWHHWLNGHEFEQAPGVGDGQGRLVCCSPQDGEESDTTERLNNNNEYWSSQIAWGCKDGVPDCI